VLLENLLRFDDGCSVTVDHLKAMQAWLDARTSELDTALHQPPSIARLGGPTLRHSMPWPFLPWRWCSSSNSSPS
jgi:hypothetical protein